MRPEVVWKRVRGGRAWHIFLEGANEPVCGSGAGSPWRTSGGGSRSYMHVHRECWRLCPWEPRLNRVMTQEEIDRELD